MIKSISYSGHVEQRFTSQYLQIYLRENATINGALIKQWCFNFDSNKFL